MDSKTTFFELDGKQFKVELVEAEFEISTDDKVRFIFGLKGTDFQNKVYRSVAMNGFFHAVNTLGIVDQWQNYLTSKARKRGFVSGCTIKTATDMDKMKSGKMQLIGLSKLATDGRKSIVIYDNGRWVAEAIPAKSLWEMMRDGSLRQILNKPNTWDVGSLLTRDEMSQVKCKPEKLYNIDDVMRIIVKLTNGIESPFYSVAITKDHARLIREILNNYLK